MKQVWITLVLAISGCLPAPPVPNYEGELDLIRSDITDLQSRVTKLEDNATVSGAPSDLAEHLDKIDAEIAERVSNEAQLQSKLSDLSDSVDVLRARD